MLEMVKPGRNGLIFCAAMDGTYDWYIGLPNDDPKKCNLWLQLVISKHPMFSWLNWINMALLILHAHRSVLNYLAPKRERKKCYIFKIVFILGFGCFKSDIAVCFYVVLHSFAPLSFLVLDLQVSCFGVYRQC